MDISKKKKTAIILGASAAVLATSAIITGIVYSKMNRQKPIDDDQKIIDAGISQDDNIKQKPSSWDSKTEEKFNKLVKYAEALTRVLKASSANARKSMSVQNLKNEIERLKNLIDKAEKTMPILDESITNLEKYKVKKDKLTEVRNELNKALNDAKDALDFANLAYNKMINNKSLMQSKINELIKLIDETIKKSQSAVYQKQIKSFIDKLTDCNNVGDGFVKDAERLNLETEKTNLIAAIERSKAEIKRLEELLKNSLSEDEKKEALKKAIEQFEKDVNEIVAKVDTTTDLEDMKDLSKQIDELKNLGKDYKNDAEQLGLNDEVNKVNEAIKKLEDAKTKIEQKIAQKEQEVDKLKKDVKKLLEDLDVAMGECINAKTIDEFDAAISKLAKLIADGETLLTKTKEAKLVDETSELETKLERAKKVLEQTKEKRDAKSKIVDEWKTKINDEINALKAKVDATKNANTIATLEPALKELENAINHANGILSDANNFEEKLKIQAEINQLTQAIADANTEKQTSAQRLEQLKNINAELVRKTNEAIQKANAAIEEAKNNQNSDDKLKLEIIINNLNDAKTQLDTTKTEVSQEPSLVKQIEDKTTEVNEWITKISDQKQKVEQKEAEIAQKKEEINKAIKDLQDKIDEVDEAIGNKNKDNIQLTKENLEKSIEEAEKIIEKIKDEPKLEEDKKKLQDKIDAAKEKVKEAQDALDNINKKEEEAKKKVEEANEKLDKAIKEAQEADKDDADKLKEANDNLDKAIEEAEDAKKAAEDANLDKEAEDLGKKIKDAKEEKKKIEDALAEVEAKNLAAIKAKIADAIKDLNEAIKEINEALEDQNKHDLVKTEQAIEKVKNALEKANKVKTETEANKAKYETEFNELTAKITTAIEKQTLILAQKARIEKERKDADEKYDVLKQSFDTNSSLYDNNKEDLAKVTSAILELEKDLENANNLLKESKDIKYDELTAKVQTLINDITLKLNEARTKKQVLEDEKATEDARIKKLKEDLVDKTQKLQKAIDELNGANGIDNQEEALKSLKKAIQDAQTFDNNISDEDKTKNVKTEYDVFKDKLDAANELANNKTTSIQAAKDAIDAKVNAIETKVNTAIKNANEAINEKDKTKLEASKLELNKLGKDLATLATEISGSGYKKAIDKVTTLQTTVNDKKQEVDNALNAETNRINAVKEALEKALTDFKTAKQKVTDNQSNIDELTKALDAFRTQYNLSKAEYDKYNKPENTKIPVLKKALDDLNDALKTYKEFEKEEKQKLENKTNALDKRLEKAKENAKKAIDKYIAAGEDKTKIEDALKDLIASSKELEKLHTDATTEGYKKVIDESKKELDKVNEKIKEAIGKLDGKTLQDIKDTIKKLEDIRTKDIPAATKVRDIAGLSPKQLVLNEAKKNYENWTKNPQNLANKEIKDELDKLNTEIENTQQALTQKITHLEAIKNRLDKEYKDAFDKTNPLLNESLDGKNIKELNELLTNLENVKKDDLTKIKQSSINNGYDEVLQSSNKLIGKIEEKIEKVKEAIEKLNKDILTELNQLISKLNTEITKINKLTKVDDLDKFTPFKSLIDTTQTRYAQLEKLKDNFDTETKEKLTQLNQVLETANGAHNTNKATLEGKKKASDDKYNEANDFAQPHLETANGSLDGKSAAELETLANNLTIAKEKAEASKSLAQTNGYSAKVTQSQTLITNIENAIEKVNEAIEKESKKILKQIEDLTNELNDLSTLIDSQTRVDNLDYLSNDLLDQMNQIKTKNANLATNANNSNNPEVKQKYEELNNLVVSVSNKLTQKINTLQTIKNDLDKEYQKVLDESNPLLNDSTDEKLKGKTIDELTTLRQKLSSAKTHASDVYQHAYNAGYTKKSDEALELQGKIEAAYKKVTDLIKEAEKARALIQEINDKIAEIQGEKAKITEEIKQKVDPLEQLIDTLKENNKNWLQFAQEKAKDPLYNKRDDVKTAIKNLYDEIITMNPLIADLTNKWNANKEEIDRALQAAINKEKDKRVLINGAKISKDITQLENAIGYLEEILGLAKNAQTLESQKEYAAKKIEIDQLVKRISDEIAAVKALLKEAKELKQLYEEKLQAIDNFEYIYSVRKEHWKTTLKNKKSTKEEILEVWNAALNEENQYKVSTEANHLAAKNLEDFITGLNNEAIYKNLIDDSTFTHNKYKVEKGKNNQQTIENNTKTLIDYLNKAKETKKGIDQNIAKSDIEKISWTIQNYLKNNYPSYINWSSNPYIFFTINDPNNIAWKYNISFEYSLNDETGTLFAKFTYQSINNPDIKITKLMEVSGFKKFDVSKITYELDKFEGKNNDVIYSPKYLYDSLKKYDDFQKMLDDYHFYGSGHKPDKSKMILNDISYDNQGNFELKYLIEKEIPIASQFGDTNTKKIQTNIKTFKFSVLSKVKEEIEKIINKFDQNVDLSEIDVPNKIFPSDVKTNDKIDFKFKYFFNNDWLSVFEIKIKEIIPNDKDGYFICKYEINSKQFPELKKVFEAKSGSKNLYDKKQVKTNVKFKKDLWEELTNPNNTYEEFNQKRNSFFEKISSNPNSDIAIQNLKKLFELSLDKKFNDSRIKYVDGIFKLQTKMIIGKETNGDYKYEYVDVLNLNIESIKEKIKDSIYKYRHYTIMEKVFKDNDIISILNDPSFHEIKPDLSKIKNEIAKWKNDFYNNFLEQGYTISDEWLGGQFNFKLSQVLNIIEVDKLYSEIFTKVGNIDYSKRAEISELIKNRYTKNDPWIH